MSDEKRMSGLQPGDHVATRTGRTATVTRIDPRTGDVHVLFPAEGAAFRPSFLKVLAPSSVVLLPFGTSAEHVTPAANDEEHEA